MDRYTVVPYTTGGYTEFYDIQTDKGRRLDVKLSEDTAKEVCIELNAAWEAKTHG